MGLISWLKDFFSKWIKVFKEFIDEAIPVVRQIIIAKLKDIALEAVTALSKTDLNNEEKRAEAFKLIKDYAIKNGIDARDSIINVVIELAVLTFKKDI